MKLQGRQSTKINKLGNKPIVSINKTKSWFFEKTSKLESPVARLRDQGQDEEAGQKNTVLGMRNEIEQTTHILR